jgi:Mg2+ and Co2+ transporter CorA
MILLENVKLLTSVSIFFLPLAYTTSLFSINNELFYPKALPWASLIVALIT